MTVKRIGFVVCSAALDVEGDALPAEFQIFRPGVNATSKGDFTFDAAAAAEVMACYARDGVDCMIDVEHDSLSDAARAARNDASDAAGWYNLELRADGSLWAVNVRWTPEGERRLRAKTQRYISPAFAHTDDGRVTYVLNVGLVSMPATYGAAPLVAAARTTIKVVAPKKRTATLGKSIMDPELVKKALALLESGDLDPAVAAFLKDLVASAAGAPAGETPPGEALAETPEPKPDEAMAAALASRDATIAALTARLDSADAERLAGETVERRALVGELVKLGSETPATAWEGPPEKHVVCKRLAAEPIADMKARVAALRAARPATLSREHEPPESGGDDIAAGVAKLSKAERAACKKAGVSEEEYVQNKRGAARRVGK